MAGLIEWFFWLFLLSNQLVSTLKEGLPMKQYSVYRKMMLVVPIVVELRSLSYKDTLLMSL